MGIMKLAPAGKSFIWGGTKLRERYGKDIPLSPLAETWECSVHPDGKSIVISGENAGMTLSEVIEREPALLGSRCKEGFPVLIKLIDAADDLSVQVHPDDVYARLHGCKNGKHEMWHILEAEEGSRIAYGFKKDMTREKVREAIASGTLEKYLNYVKVKKGDTFFIPAGTVHSIGKGIVLAEIQQDCNITYRIYDYDRTDKDGNKRPLHIENALEVMSLSPVDYDYDGDSISCRAYEVEVLCHCRAFRTIKAVVRTEMDIMTDERSFRAILCIGGEGNISGGGESMDIKKGECIFLPAGRKEYTLSGKAEYLIVSR